MGTSQLADALTGLSIPRQEPIVALVVERRTGGYPDATTHAAMSPLSPSAGFEPVSLPIRGRAGDYGDIEPDEGDLGAALMLALANKPDWRSLSEVAFGHKAAILLGPAAHGAGRPVFHDPGDDEPRALGIVAFAASTWDRVVGLGTGTLDRGADVSTILGAIASAREAARAGDRDLMAMNLYVTTLSKSNAYARDGSRPNGFSSTRLPPLGRALAGREGGDLVSGTASDWFGNDGMIGYRLTDEDPDARLPEFLGMVWDLQAAERGMDVLCRTWQPSYGAGQHDNATEVATMATETLAESTGRLIDRLEEGFCDEDEVAAVEAMLARLDEVRASLAGRLDAVRADMAPAP